MNTDKNETQAQAIEMEQPKLNAEQQWALRMADGRHRELTARVEEVAVGTAKTAVAVEGIDTKVNAILEAVAPEAPKSFIGGVFHALDKRLGEALVYLRPIAAMAAVGYGGAKAVQGVQSWRQRRAEAKAAAALPPATPSAS